MAISKEEVKENGALRKSREGKEGKNEDKCN
jgi:hypothetical protein